MSTEEKKAAAAPASGPQGLLMAGVVITLAAIAFIIFLIATGRGAAPVESANMLNAAAPAGPAAPAPPAGPGAQAPNRGTLLPSGLRIETIREGSGPLVTRADAVLIRYELRLPGGPVIESNMDAPQPAPMRLDGVIPGFAEGLTRMRPGGEARLWVPPQLGYGPSTPPGAPFGPNDTLEFRIRVEGIVPAGGRPASAPGPDNSSNTTQAATERPNRR